mmetsp:Transcript_17467/g.52245  ORF Transcript_17467/g.52245 Transcript_17467/m.52245 type:complete len:1232 (+) Transcript_17467:129-3824(+)
MSAQPPPGPPSTPTATAASVSSPSSLYRLIEHRSFASRGQQRGRMLPRHVHAHEALMQRMSVASELSAHRGCVNRLCWNRSGSLLASVSDDLHLCLWSYPPLSTDSTESPTTPTSSRSSPSLSSSSPASSTSLWSSPPIAALRLRMRTGHQNNIFGVAFLPHHADHYVVTGAMDSAIIIHNVDIGKSCVIRAHSDRVKEIEVDPSDPHTFWSAGEDGTVRQVDVRTRDVSSLSSSSSSSSRISSSGRAQLPEHHTPESDSSGSTQTVPSSARGASRAERSRMLRQNRLRSNKRSVSHIDLLEAAARSIESDSDYSDSDSSSGASASDESGSDSDPVVCGVRRRADWASSSGSVSSAGSDTCLRPSDQSSSPRRPEERRLSGPSRSSLGRVDFTRVVSGGEECVEASSQSSESESASDLLLYSKCTRREEASGDLTAELSGANVEPAKRGEASDGRTEISDTQVIYGNPESLYRSFTPGISSTDAQQKGTQKVLVPGAGQRTLSNPCTLTAADSDDWRGRRWNERFQDICERMNQSNMSDSGLFFYQQINTELLHLSQDFIHSAKIYGRIIITERYMAKKTIPSVSMGGLAGGEKYIVHDILFKFACDSQGIYGSDFAANKVAGHELKGLMAYYNVSKDLCFPLMALVDFMGFRVIALSVLPINNDTIVYGTADGGRTVHASDPDFFAKMRQAGQQLNLCDHVCGRGSTRKVLSSAADLEGHIGTDGNSYLLDFARAMPPTQPRDSCFNGHLYQLFRAEFVRKYKVALCPDAFSGFIGDDPDRIQHNQAVRDATTYLLEELLPTTTINLKGLLSTRKTVEDIKSFHIPQLLHKDGVNLRYMGFVLYRLEVGQFSDPAEDCYILVLVEAIARVLKNLLRAELRELMLSLKVPLLAPYRQLVVSFFNRVFGDHPTFASATFWREVVATELREKFSFAPRSSVFYTPNEEDLQEESAVSGALAHRQLAAISRRRSRRLSASRVHETDAEMDERLRSILLISFRRQTLSVRFLLFRRLHELCGLQFTPTMVEKISTGHYYNAQTPFDILDLEEIGVLVKHTPIVTNAEGTFYHMKAMAAFKASSRKEARGLLEKAKEKFQEALMSNPDNTDALLNCAQTWCKILEHDHGSGKNMSNVVFSLSDMEVINTEQFFLRAVNASPTDPLPRFLYARFLARCNRFERAEQYFLSSLEIDPCQARHLRIYGFFLMERGKMAAAQAVLLRAQFESRLQYESTV